MKLDPDEAHTVGEDFLNDDFIWLTIRILPRPKPSLPNCFLLEFGVGYGATSPPVFALDIRMWTTCPENKRYWVEPTRIVPLDGTWNFRHVLANPTFMAIETSDPKGLPESCSLLVYLDEKYMKDTMELSIYAKATTTEFITHEIGKPDKPVKVHFRRE